MICLELFLTFLQIGALSFGGGFGMISLMREQALAHGWLTEAELLNVIAVSESTPGPIAVNMATFVGASEGGFWGALVATLGVVLPSFFIILIIAALIRNLLKYQGVQAFLKGVRPCIVALILANAAILLMGTLFQFKSWGDTVLPDVKGLIILFVLMCASLFIQKILHKRLSPIVMILLSAGLGIFLYAI